VLPHGGKFLLDKALRGISVNSKVRAVNLAS
jgi:hypothetical protein